MNGSLQLHSSSLNRHSTRNQCIIFRSTIGISCVTAFINHPMNNSHWFPSICFSIRYLASWYQAFSLQLLSFSFSFNAATYQSLSFSLFLLFFHFSPTHTQAHSYRRSQYLNKTDSYRHLRTGRNTKQLILLSSTSSTTATTTRHEHYFSLSGGSVNRLSSYLSPSAWILKYIGWNAWSTSLLLSPKWLGIGKDPESIVIYSTD